MWRLLLFWLLPRRRRRLAARLLDAYDLSQGRVRSVRWRWALRWLRRKL